MNLKYKLLHIALLLCLTASAATSNHGLDGHVDHVIDATKNARLHNNMGNLNFGEKNYTAALKEYQIAFNLTPNTQAAATYLYNIARCAMILGNYEMAKNCLIGAIQKDCINITYYSALADCYIALDKADDEIIKCFEDGSNPYNQIIAGLIYQKTGYSDFARTIYQNFIEQNPDMIISEDLRMILKSL